MEPNINYAYISGALETAMKYLVSDLYGKGIVKDYDADKAEEFIANKIAYLYQKEREFSGHYSPKVELKTNPQ